MTQNNKTLTAIAFLAASGANAQQFGYMPFENCNTTDHIETSLIDRYDEVVSFAGVKSPVLLERLWINTEEGTYTFTRTNVQEGMTCIISIGSYGQMITPVIRPNL